ncbi:MAG: zinc dependent phospholipase C family protein [Crenarchaeota archaeon]|nr:zinc dependent phospholipase C family protein [Thermoproteota archaeon]
MGKSLFRIFSLIILGFLLASRLCGSSYGWSNGGYSDDPFSPKYGTHDWIAQHALDWLPDEEKDFIISNLATYLYGSELPDNGRAPDGIGDTLLHHVYYHADRSLQDDASAIRAQEEFEKAVSLYLSGKVSEAVKRLGAMTHYISDMAVFAHVMGSSTDWGNEKHHSDYEDYVNRRTSSYNSEFNVFLSFDGTLDKISAYNATLRLAFDTTFDVNGSLTCVWMDRNYDWNNPVFRNRCGESLNLAVNLVADVLHTFYLRVSSPLMATVTFSASGLENDASGTVLIVDGVGYSYAGLPRNFTWKVGSTHTFEWANTVDAGGRKRYAWFSTHGLSINQNGSIKVPSDGGFISATYHTEYYLTMLVNPSGGGLASPCSGWYRAGSMLEIDVAPAPGYRFINWTGLGAGSYTGLSRSAFIKMNSPILQKANLEAFSFMVSVSPQNGTALAGETLTATVNVSLLSGSPLVVSLSALNLPNGVSITFTPDRHNPPFTSSLKIKVANNTPAGTYVINIVCHGGNLTRAATYVLTVKAQKHLEIIIGIIVSAIIFLIVLIIMRRGFLGHDAKLA